MIMVNYNLSKMAQIPDFLLAQDSVLIGLHRAGNGPPGGGGTESQFIAHVSGFGHR